MELTVETLPAYLHDRGIVPDHHAMVVAALGGGISNDVWRVQWPDGDIVIKQALPFLRVASLPTSCTPISPSGLITSINKNVSHDVGREGPDNMWRISENLNAEARSLLWDAVDTRLKERGHAA